jgi:hypothetical protein
MEQELKPRQQVNLCMSVYFYSCNFGLHYKRKEQKKAGSSRSSSGVVTK